MCGSMVDIQSATAEIRRGKKIEEETTGQKYNGLPYYIGRVATIINLVMISVVHWVANQ